MDRGLLAPVLVLANGLQLWLMGRKLLSEQMLLFLRGSILSAGEFSVALKIATTRLGITSKGTEIWQNVMSALTQNGLSLADFVLNPTKVVSALNQTAPVWWQYATGIAGTGLAGIMLSPLKTATLKKIQTYFPAQSLEKELNSRGVESIAEDFQKLLETNHTGRTMEDAMKMVVPQTPGHLMQRVFNWTRVLQGN